MTSSKTQSVLLWALKVGGSPMIFGYHVELVETMIALKWHCLTPPDLTANHNVKQEVEMIADGKFKDSIAKAYIKKWAAKNPVSPVMTLFLIISFDHIPPPITLFTSRNHAASCSASIRRSATVLLTTYTTQALTVKPSMVGVRLVGPSLLVVGSPFIPGWTLHSPSPQVTVHSRKELLLWPSSQRALSSSLLPPMWLLVVLIFPMWWVAINIIVLAI